jgi:hypothetical protein
MHTIARIASLATVAIASLLVGMRLAPQDAAKPNANVTERYEAVQLLMKRAGEAREHGLQLPWEQAAEIETRVLWSRRFAEAAVEARAMSARDAYGKHLELLEREMTVTKSLVDAGRKSEVDVALVRFHIAEAKLLLERAK